MDVNIPPDDRSQMAVALAWVSHITSISVAMVLPGVLGYFLDQRFGTVILFTLVGVSVGMTTGVWLLVRISRESGSDRVPPDNEV